MQRIEYRVENISTDGAAPRENQIQERLNELGADGWRVLSADLEPRSSYAPLPIEVLLAREVGN